MVTKASKGKTFLAGDHIRLLENGDVICQEAHGWIDKEDVPAATKGMEFDLDHK